MSTIAAGTSSGQAISVTGDTTGNLVLTVNNTTVAVTLNTSGAIGVGTSPSYGTSGQVLVSGGSGAAPAWSSLPTVNLTTGVTGTLPIANGGTNTTATPTAGTVPYGTGTALAYTAAGTSGQVLTSAGSGAPTWTTPSAGAMTLISTKTASSSASLEWTGLSGYSCYLLIINNLIPAVSGLLYMQYGTGAGPTYETTGYGTAWPYSTSYQNTTTSGYVVAGSASLGNVFNNGQGAWGIININRFSGGGYPGAVANIGWSTSSVNNEIPRPWVGQASASTTAKTAIKLYYDSGNISSGTASLYGIST